MPKSPSFQFYAADFVSDINVATMTMEQRGQYITLLCYDWISGHIPDDDEALRFLCGGLEVPENVRSLFIKTGHNNLTNPRLKKERSKQKIHRGKCSDAGKASAKARKEKKLQSQRTCNERSTNVPPKSNSSTSSSTSIKKEKSKPKKKVYGDHQNVTLSDDEFERLITGWGADNCKFTEDGRSSAIEELSGYKARKGTDYKSDYAAMQHWPYRNWVDGKGGQGLINAD